ncbi:MAG: TonB-dependent receptor plug domain-containing protein [Polyangiaceae bacterium]|nr:TonB-dependent receptor plug domain-containing protein [Polyangiaceae bacterium]
MPKKNEYSPGVSTPSEAPVQQTVGSTGHAIDVVVQGRSSDGRRLRDSADAVKVVDTHYAKQQARDLGDVLSGVEGVVVRRTGGLGSFTRISLNGLYDNQIRFFFDGIPLDIAGSPFGISSVPVNLVGRIEIYRGVLPVRFGADALGGGVNLVPTRLDDSNAYISYQRGSFGTHRATASARYHHRPSGFFVSGTGLFDISRNDYGIDVMVADKTGRKRDAHVRRFHDEYRSYGGSVVLGVADKPWAKRLSLQLFGLNFDKQIQHDVLMARPIGEAKYGASSLGATLRWEHDFSRRVSTEVVASFGRQTIRFLDTSKWTYDWFGNRVAERSVGGELDSQPHDATIWQNSMFGRALVEWRARPDHTLRIASTARMTSRTGTEKATRGQDGIDLLAGVRDIGTLVSGLEYELNAFDMRPPDAREGRPHRPADDDRLQNIFTLKHYFYDANAKDVKTGFGLESLDTSGWRFGVGDGLRFRLNKKVALKASYELATRIPNIEEFFGDSLYIQPNLSLKPEFSHNGNAGVLVETRRTRAGNFTLEADGFLREVTDLIVPFADANGVQYANVGGARIVGVETAVKWISPGNWLIVDGNATWQDARNRSGEFGGERIPNRPWLFANWSARFQWRKVLTSDDGVAPYYAGRFVHEFFRTWENIGDPDFKAVIPTQISHTLGITYWNNTPSRTSVTLEVDNVTDARLYDFFGVQKPGRAFSVKVTGEL